jgi:acetyltransferase-like isoleucine patch superfamily enzyme
MKKLLQLRKACRNSNSNFLIVLIRYLLYKTRGKNILAHQKAKIKGVDNITSNGLLKIGIDYVGFIHNKDVTYLNIKGKMEFQGNSSIGRGCRFDIGQQATVKIGRETYINPFTTIIIMHGLQVGEGCAISWNCQFLDEDFHHLEYEGKKKTDHKGITIGNKVWVGSNSCIYKGTVIPAGCVIAANTVVKGVFEEENVLIAGNPAKIVKRNVSW